LLANRGVGLAEHRLSGSSQVVIGGPGEQPRTAESRPASASEVKRAQRVVEETITRFLQAQASDETWQVDAKLTDAQVRLVPVDAQKISLRGGQPPGIGRQEFELTIDDAVHPATFLVAANVSQLSRVVVAAKAIGRGEIIRSTDLRLERPETATGSAETLHAVDDAIGMEAAQAIPAGAVLRRSLLRSPIMVRRGEAITVYSRTAGIRVRVSARAREDAALGDLVTVESLPDRKRYTARVCGPQEAEVYARAIQPASTAPSDPAPRPVGKLARSPGRSTE
jgi:flagella basal body P-ring formation protein FlgA